MQLSANGRSGTASQTTLGLGLHTRVLDYANVKDISPNHKGELMSHLKAAGTRVTKETAGNTRLSQFEILQHTQGPPAQKESGTI